MLHGKLSLSYFEIHLSKFESYICFQGLSTSNMEIVAGKYSGFIKIILEIHVCISFQELCISNTGKIKTST